ncbi:MAG: phosphotransferase family protein [Paenisporosarcina sp.]
MSIQNLTQEEFWQNHKNHSIWDEVVRTLLEKENIQFQTISRFPMGGNIVYSIDDQMVLKLFSPFDSREFFIETDVIEKTDWNQIDIEVPKVLCKGTFEGWHYLIMTRVQGTLLIDVWNDLSHDERVTIATDLGKLIKQMHTLNIEVYEELDRNFDNWIMDQKKRVKNHHIKTGLASHIIDDVEDFVSSFETSSEQVLLTGEYTPFNLIVNRQKDKWTITGLIDFADCFIGEPNYDLLGPILFNFYKESGLTSAFLNSYGIDLTDAVRNRLMQLLLLHRFSNLPNYLDGEIDNLEVESLESLFKRFFT